LSKSLITLGNKLPQSNYLPNKMRKLDKGAFFSLLNIEKDEIGMTNDLSNFNNLSDLKFNLEYLTKLPNIKIKNKSKQKKNYS